MGLTGCPSLSASPRLRRVSLQYDVAVLSAEFAHTRVHVFDEAAHRCAVHVSNQTALVREALRGNADVDVQAVARHRALSRGDVNETFVWSGQWHLHRTRVLVGTGTRGAAVPHPRGAGRSARCGTRARCSTCPRRGAAARCFRAARPVRQGLRSVLGRGEPSAQDATQ